MIDLHTHLWPHEPGTPMPSYEQLARDAVASSLDQIGVDTLTTFTRREHMKLPRSR
jgi:hypothetical protein